jgi:hypothetical protein
MWDDAMQRDQAHLDTPEGPRHYGHSADDWLAERLFNPSDITRIKNAVSQWVTDREAAWNALGRQKKGDPSYLRFEEIGLDTGTQLEFQLKGREQFHGMIRDCANRLHLAPGEESNCFAPPKPVPVLTRFTGLSR